MFAASEVIGMRLVLRPREEERLEDTPANSKSGELRPILEAIIGGGPQWSKNRKNSVITNVVACHYYSILLRLKKSTVSPHTPSVMLRLKKTLRGHSHIIT